MSAFWCDLDRGLIFAEDEGTISLDTPKAFEILSRAWLRSGWGNKYVYSFSWLGRPIIQLPEDLIRIQEVIYDVKPDLLIETGIAHGGSLVFYAGLFKIMGKGRVLGIDVGLRRENRFELENHVLKPLIKLIDGSSVDREVAEKVRNEIKPEDKVMVVLDSNHTREHVLQELQMYGELVTPESYMIVCDGILKDLAGAPRTSEDCHWNNPFDAINLFLKKHAEFKNDEPKWTFNESFLSQRVTYWPAAFLKKVGLD